MDRYQQRLVQCFPWKNREDFRASCEWGGWEMRWGMKCRVPILAQQCDHSPCSRAGHSRCPRWLWCWWCGCPSPQQADRSTSYSPSFLPPLEPRWDLLAENPPHETRCLHLRRKGTILSRLSNPNTCSSQSHPKAEMYPVPAFSCQRALGRAPTLLLSSLLCFPSSALPGSTPPPEEECSDKFLSYTGVSRCFYSVGSWNYCLSWQEEEKGEEGREKLLLRVGAMVPFPFQEAFPPLICSRWKTNQGLLLSTYILHLIYLNKFTLNKHFYLSSLENLGVSPSQPASDEDIRPVSISCLSIKIG